MRGTVTDLSLTIVDYIRSINQGNSSPSLTKLTFCFSFWSWWRWWKRGLCCRRNIVVFSVRFLSCWSHMFLIRIVKLRLHCCCCCCLRCCCCCYLLVSTSSTGVLVEAESNIRFVVTVGAETSSLNVFLNLMYLTLCKDSLADCQSIHQEKNSEQLPPGLMLDTVERSWLIHWINSSVLSLIISCSDLIKMLSHENVTRSLSILWSCINGGILNVLFQLCKLQLLSSADQHPPITHSTD